MAQFAVSLVIILMVLSANISVKGEKMEKQATDKYERAKDKVGDIYEKTKGKAQEYRQEAMDTYDQAKESAAKYKEEAKEKAGDYRQAAMGGYERAKEKVGENAGEEEGLAECSCICNRNSEGGEDDDWWQILVTATVTMLLSGNVKELPNMLMIALPRALIAYGRKKYNDRQARRLAEVANRVGEAVANRLATAQVSDPV